MNLATEVIDVAALPSAQPVEAVFAGYRAELEKLQTTATTITVTDEADVRGMKLARETRLALRQIRIDAEKRRKDLKEDYLRRGQKIDAAYREIAGIIEPLEARLREQEEFAARLAVQRSEALRSERLAALGAIQFPATGIDVAALSDEQWQSLLVEATAARKARVEAARKADEERIAREKAEAEERERVTLENERLRAEAARLEAERNAAAAEKAKIEAAAAAERAKAAAEVARLQAERDAAEKAEWLRQEAAAKAAAKAAAAPDAEKLRAFAAALLAVPMPEFSTPAAKAAAPRITDEITKLTRRIEATAETLGGNQS